MKFSGVFIAPVTAISSTGELNFEPFHQLIDYLLDFPLAGICLGGATSEFCRCPYDEKAKLVRRVAEQLAKRTQLIVAIGACSYSESLELGNLAAQRGADALLIPPPYFYRYSQEDLEYFYRSLAKELISPALLYNIPQFTNPLEVKTSIRLLQTEPNLIGIKDSSGDRKRLVQFSKEQFKEEKSLFIGQDSLFYDALDVGWDGIISGLGNLCPDLCTNFYTAFRSGRKEEALSQFARIEQLSSRLGKLPAPWGIRVGLAVLGIDCGPPALPLSSERTQQIEQFRSWFKNWLKEVHGGPQATIKN